MTAEERASDMFMNMPMNKLPLMASVYLKDLSRRVGACSEVCITAYATYAQLTEGLECKDDLYKPDAKEIAIYRQLESETIK